MDEHAYAAGKAAANTDMREGFRRPVDSAKDGPSWAKGYRCEVEAWGAHAKKLPVRPAPKAAT